jgi:hypothetical protein
MEAIKSTTPVVRDWMESAGAADRSAFAAAAAGRGEDWATMRRAAHVLVDVSLAAKGPASSRLLTTLLGWASSGDDVKKAEAYTLFGRLRCRRRRVCEVLIAAARAGGGEASIAAADALGQIFQGGGHARAGSQQEVEEALIHMLLTHAPGPETAGHRDAEATAVRALVALCSAPAGHVYSEEREDEGSVEVTFLRHGALGISFGSRSAADPPFITGLKPGTLAAQFPQLRDGLVLQSVQGEGVAGLAFADAIARIKGAARPLTLTFAAEPQAAEPGAAAAELALPGPDATIEQLQVRPRAPLHSRLPDEILGIYTARCAES